MQLGFVLDDEGEFGSVGGEVEVVLLGAGLAGPAKAVSFGVGLVGGRKKLKFGFVS